MDSNNITIIGLQWGDEGKGKLVDALSPSCKYVVRFCGGANAGHTVIVGDQKFALHLIPSGILRDDIVNVVGNGVVFDPTTAMEEINGLVSRDVKIGPEKLLISHCAHVVMPWHKLEDRLSEESLGGKKIGTTARGIGPCYADKARRSTAIRVGDLIDPEVLRHKIDRIVGIKNKTFAALYNAEPMNADEIYSEYMALGKTLKPHVCNTGSVLRKATQRGDGLLFEGGQGSMLDIDHGTFPFVTSSPVTACGVPQGSGIPPRSIGRILGIVKAYTTRVGAGPFPSEQDNEIGQRIRDRGNEYGTTTGRPRRCGWLDAFAVKYAIELSGVDEIALTLFDVLSGFDTVKICTGYRKDGEELEYFEPDAMSDVECIYEEVPGWGEEITDCKSYDDLPESARKYVDRLEEYFGIPIGYISVGPERTQTIPHHTKISGLGQ
ncbi:MAG: adenylosuccinate synthase [Phycisphaerae bacterium]